MYPIGIFLLFKYRIETDVRIRSQFKHRAFPFQYALEVMGLLLVDIEEAARTWSSSSQSSAERILLTCLHPCGW